MGRPFQQKLNGSRVYSCSACKCHISDHEDIISKVPGLFPDITVLLASVLQDKYSVRLGIEHLDSLAVAYLETSIDGLILEQSQVRKWVARTDVLHVQLYYGAPFLHGPRPKARLSHRQWGILQIPFPNRTEGQEAWTVLGSINH